MDYNIKFGDKVIDKCITVNCPVYPCVIGISNLGGLKGIVKCPDKFCERIQKKTDVCSNCNNTVPIWEGYYDLKKGKFYCFQCDKSKEKIEDEIEINNAKDKNSEFDVKFKIINEALQKRWGEFDIKSYCDINNDRKILSFYTPLGSHIPLIWKFDYFNITNETKLIDELSAFFDEFLEKFEKKTCDNCKFVGYQRSHMMCVDCVRNENSMATLKKDHYQ